MLARRLLSAAAGIPILVLVIVKGGIIYDVVLAAVLGLATAELLIQAGLTTRTANVWLAAVAAAALGLLTAAPATWSFAILAIFILASLLASLASTVSAPAADRWSLAVGVALYVGLLGRYLGLLRHGSDGRAWVLFVVFATFASDTSAYLVGRLVGRHQLAGRISPAKTIEGAAGGLVGAALAGLALRFLLGLPAAPALALGMGLLVSVAAQMGDLAESALKRRLGVKDAGLLVPGHGGLLDRLDSLLFSGAMVYYVLQWISL